MSDKEVNQKVGQSCFQSIPSTRRMFRNILPGRLPVILLCAALIVTLKVNVADAAAETFLAAQSVTVRGTVTAPSCTVKLGNGRMSFERNSGGGPEVQTLHLNLSQCEADAVGVMFKAEHWPDNPVRGTLREVQSKERDSSWYYTISPGAEKGSGSIIWPLRLAEHSPAPEADKQAGSNTHDVFFNLAQVNYWYDLTRPLKENDVMVIPFDVRVHNEPIKRKGNSVSATDDALESNFMLQLSWR